MHSNFFYAMIEGVFYKNSKRKLKWGKIVIALSVNQVSKAFGITSILENISFTVSQGDKVGLIGRNGAGKTTLFKIIKGEYTADQGTIYMAKGAEVGYLEQVPAAVSGTSLYEYCLEIFRSLLDMEAQLRNLEHEIAELSKHGTEPSKIVLDQYSHLLEDFSRKNGYGFRSEVRGVLKGLGFSENEFERNIEGLSGGQKSRLGIGRLLLRKPEILLLDEPTNHLDIDACAWLENYLKAYDGTLIIISHDRYFLDQIITRVFEVEQRQLTPYTGNYTDYVRQKEVNFETAVRTFEQQQKEIEKQEEIIRRFKGHGTEKLTKRAKSREKMLDKMEVVDRPVQYTKRAKIRLSTRIKSGEDVLFAEELSKSYGEKHLFSHVNVSAFRGDRIGLIGPNGIGKTTLFKMLMGTEPYQSGQIHLGHQVEIGMYDQEQSNLNYANDLVEEISDEDPRLSVTEIRGMLGGFLFHGDDVFKKINQLSGGEKGRISLLKLMMSKSNLLLLDEPTNHLDIESKEALEDALSSYDGTIITISHDRYFLNKICTKILDLSPEGSTEYLGNYDYYKEKISFNAALEEDLSEEPSKTKTQMKEDRRKEKERQQVERQKKQGLTNVEKEIESLETEIADIEAMMCDTAVYSDPVLMKELGEQLNHLKTTLEETYESWTLMLEEA